MLKKIVFTLLYFCSLVLFQNFTFRDEGKIYWIKNNLLTWDDFKKTPPSNKYPTISAITSAGIEIDYNIKEGVLEVKILSCFYPHNSWVKHPSERLLKHEQGHFDITEIFARELRMDIVKMKYNKRNFKDKINKIYSKNKTEYHLFQKLYDNETDLSRNEKKQVEWNRKIAERLDELEKYSNPVIQIKW